MMTTDDLTLPRVFNISEILSLLLMTE